MRLSVWLRRGAISASYALIFATSLLSPVKGQEFLFSSFFTGWEEGSGSFRRIWDLAVDDAGIVYVLGDYTLKKVHLDGTIENLAGKPLVWDVVNGEGDIARFESPECMALSSDGVIYVGEQNINALADSVHIAIRKFTTDGVLSAFVGGNSATWMVWARPLASGV